MNEFHENIDNLIEGSSQSLCSIDDLNDDCLRKIFQNLPIIDRIRIERVSKRWQLVSKDSWHAFKDLNLDPDVWGLPGPWVSARRSVCINNKILENVLMRCGRFIKYINIFEDNPSQVWHEINYVTLEIFSTWCFNLETLRTNILNNGRGLRIIKSSCSNFKQFYFMAQTFEIFDDDFLNLFKVMTKFNRLWLTNCLFTGKCLSYLPMDKIQEIYLQNCSPLSEPNLYNAIRRLEVLHTLVLDRCCSINDNIVEALTYRAKTLKALALYDAAPGFTENGLKLITKLICLEKLRIDANEKVTDEVINVITKNCSKLTFLSVCSTSITDKGILSISSLSKLRHLKIANLKQVTGQYLERIHTLEFLDCKHCTVLQTDNICAVIELLPHLQILDLEGCPLIDDKVIRFATTNYKQHNKLSISTGMTSIKLKQFNCDSKALCITKAFKYRGFPPYPVHLDIKENYFSDYYKPARYHAFIDIFDNELQ